jgi:acyl-CoA thioester hydrolase
VAITEYWRALGRPYPAAFEGTGVDLFAVKSTVEYLAPARYDDVIDVGCRAARLGRSSIGFELAIFRGAERITRGEVVYVTADPVARKSVPIPGWLRGAIERFEAEAA